MPLTARSWICGLTVALAGVSGWARAGPGAPQPIHIEVHAAKRAAYRVPDSIFGTFLEPIGNSTYNGLWAEILQNASFEENLWSVPAMERMVKDDPQLRRASELGLPAPWEPLDARQGNRYEARWGDAANSWRSLAILGLPGAETGVRQQVYLPMPREVRYLGSIYIKHLSGAAGVEVSLRRRDHPEDEIGRAHV